jgi:hypothetical protein
VRRDGPGAVRVRGELVNFWSSPNFERPRRSWPWPPTKLERIAENMGIDDEELCEPASVSGRSHFRGHDVQGASFVTRRVVDMPLDGSSRAERRRV